MTGRHPGAWPVDKPAALVENDEQGEQHLALVKAQALWVMPLDSIRVQLEEQPSSASIRSIERRLKAEITAIADNAVQRLRNTG